MANITCELERKFLKMNGFFKAILVTGARQVGKTTMLTHLAESTDRTYVEENAIVHPLEIKKSANPDKREVKKYSVLDKAELDCGSGGIVCMCEEPIPIDEKNCFIPRNLI